MSKETIFKILRLISLQGLWFLFVMTSHLEISRFSPLLAVLCILIDKYLFYPKLELTHFLKNILLILFIGIFIDSVLLHFSVISFSNWPYPVSAPFMWAIWISMIPYFQFSFDLFYKIKWLGMIIMFFGAPITYSYGATISNLSVTKYPPALLIGFMWAVFFPLLLDIFKKYGKSQC